MKLFIVIATVGVYAALAFVNPSSTATIVRETPTEVYTLSKDGTEKAVIFNHANHATKNYSVDGTRPIACVECHHTEQPAAEAAKTPGLKTAHPADRTTTLTAETSASMDVQECRSCHARADEKPKVGSETPSIKREGETDPEVLTNELAYHRNCAACHDAAQTARKTVKAPGEADCKGCHTGPK
jgi:cytochrome c553